MRAMPARSRLLLLVALAASLGCGAEKTRLVIDFGSNPAELEGAEVDLDGKIVGKLARERGRPRTTFEVGIGKHEVFLRHPRYDCRQASVAVDYAGQEVVLYVDFMEGSRNIAGQTPSLVLKR